MVLLDLVLLFENLDLISDFVLSGTLNTLVTIVPLIPLVEGSIKCFLLVRCLVKSPNGLDARQRGMILRSVCNIFVCMMSMVFLIITPWTDILTEDFLILLAEKWSRDWHSSIWVPVSCVNGRIGTRHTDISGVCMRHLLQI